MKLLLLNTVLLIFLLPIALTAQVESDSLILQPVTVSGFSPGEAISKQKASISYIEPKEYQYFSPHNPVMAWNSLPGVNLEQRAVGSYRVNIRGSSIRSPFGVRNVKFYWNGLPFTEANGTTPLNLLSNTQMRKVEVIRGPAGSLYGAGLGGVVQLSNFPNDLSPLNIAISGGSFGQFGANVKGEVSSGGWDTFYAVDFFKNDGYREQNALNRKNYQLSSQYKFNESHKIQLHLLLNDLYYEIPGGLTEEQFQDDPTQARANSESQNSSINQQTLLAGINYTSFLSRNLSQTTALNYTSTWFDHPFLFDYKIDRNHEIGLRNQWTYDRSFQEVNVRVDAGLEYQYGNNSAKNYGNVNGVRDTINFSDQLLINRGLLFAQLDLEFMNWSLTAGVSSNILSYKVDRKINADGPAFNFSRNFNNEVIPRISIAYDWDRKNMTYASISEGFSSPTLDEIRTNEGSINRDLEAERGISFEVGHKFYSNDFNISASIFLSRLDESITTFTDQNGTVLFQNSGNTEQLGVEIGALLPIFKRESGFIRKINSRVSYNYYAFRFSDYSQQEVDFDGNRLSGIPEHNFNNRLAIEFVDNLQVSIHNRVVSEIPLNDENTIYSNAFFLTNLQLAYSFKFLGDLRTSFGIENLTNEQYSLGYDLNAFGNRFFQPAPGRNYYLSFQYSL